MSRVGKKKIEIPKGTSVEIKNGQISAKGSKGTVSQDLLPGFAVEEEDGQLKIVGTGKDGKVPSPALHGLTRALVANAVEGVTNGFVKTLDIVGVGYRAEEKGREVHLALGFSHPVIFKMPDGVDVAVDPKANRLTVTGIEKQKVGQVAAELRALRPPDAYKGKGIRYTGERLILKVGKSGAK